MGSSACKHPWRAPSHSHSSQGKTEQSYVTHILRVWWLLRENVPTRCLPSDMIWARSRREDLRHFPNNGEAEDYPAWGRQAAWFIYELLTRRNWVKTAKSRAWRDLRSRYEGSETHEGFIHIVGTTALVCQPQSEVKSAKSPFIHRSSHGRDTRLAGFSGEFLYPN